MRVQRSMRRSRLSHVLDFFDYVYAFLLLAVFGGSLIAVVTACVFVLHMFVSA